MTRPRLSYSGAVVLAAIARAKHPVSTSELRLRGPSVRTLRALERRGLVAYNTEFRDEYDLPMWGYVATERGHAAVARYIECGRV
jgi:hypothetical protein